MEKLTVILEELDEIDFEWKKKLCGVKNIDDIGEWELVEKINELIRLIRPYKKNQDDEHIAMLSKMIDDQYVLENLLGFVEKTLVYYNIMIDLRNIEKEDKKIVSLFLQDVVENYIARVDPQIVERCRDYHLQNEEDIKKMLRAIDCLTEYYVRKMFTKKTIEEDFREETELTQENCRIYSELVDKYYHEIKMNIIMQDLELCKACCLKE